MIIFKIIITFFNATYIFNYLFMYVRYFCIVETMEFSYFLIESKLKIQVGSAMFNCFV